MSSEHECPITPEVSREGTPAADERPVRRVRLSKDLAAMAEIDQVMCELDEFDATLVTRWFNYKFGPLMENGGRREDR